MDEPERMDDAMTLYRNEQKQTKKKDLQGKIVCRMKRLLYFDK